MSSNVCHDFKSPRPGASNGLPKTFVLVPVLFYLALAAAAWVGVNSTMSIKKHNGLRDAAISATAGLEAEKLKIENQVNILNSEKDRAEKLAQWVEGTRTVQPISVEINRAMAAGTTLSDLSIERSAELPAQLNLNVSINNGGVEDIARLQAAFTKLNYRAFNTQQLKNGENLEYKTMLVWQAK